MFAVKGTRYVLFCPKQYIMYNQLLYVFAVKDTRFWLFCPKQRTMYDQLLYVGIKQWIICYYIC